MKKTVLSLLLIGSMFSASQAQKEQGQSVLHTDVGYSFIYALFKLTPSNSGIKMNPTPVIGLGYDYSIVDHFSLGLAANHHSIDISIPYTYTDNNNDIVMEDMHQYLSHTNIALRPLFHYGNNDRFDFYSGARLGFSVWSSSFKTTDLNYTTTNERAVILALQILTGMRAYFTDTFGMSAEFGLGSPYVANIGLNFRFPY